MNGRGFLALSDGTGYPVISDVTAHEDMVRVSGFFAWALKVEEYGLSKNLCDGLNVDVEKKNSKDARRPFTEAELIALFSHPSESARTFLHSPYFWLMSIALLTGRRLNEICQLHLVDFINVEGVDAFDCIDDAGKRLKNTGVSRRVVPIHRDLVRLGLLRYVERLRKAGEQQLFPELKAGRDGHGQMPSRWFGK